MLLLPWLHKILTTILLFVFRLCLSDVDHHIFVCTFVFHSVEISFENDGLGKFKTV